MKEKHIVSLWDVNRLVSEYPKRTFSTRDHDDIVIPMPTEGELEEYKKKRDTTSQQWRVVFCCRSITAEREVKMKYREKPVVIEVLQWTGGSEQEEDPVWVIRAIKNGVTWSEGARTLGVKLMIRTLEGIHKASMGDYIIQGIAGKMYLCKSDIFLATYGPAATKASMNVMAHLDEGEVKYEVDGL